ncbi:MAG: UbiD family decarboxylase [Thermoproteota archaeon]
MRSVDGSVDGYLDFMREKGIEVKLEQGVYSEYYEAAKVIKRYDGISPVMFRVKGYACCRFVSNLYATRKHVYLSVGARNDVEFYQLLNGLKPEDFEYGRFSDYFEHLGSGVQLLPALKFYSEDGGLYVTASLFIACTGEDRICNASIHRIMISSDKRYAAVRVVPRHLYTMLTSSGGSLPVAVVIGVDPRVLLASAMSPPYGVFELKLAAGLLKGRLKVCKTPKYGLPVPCGASMVVEGRLGPERAREGPFTDLLNLYDTVREEPVLHVENVWINKACEPLIHVILPGGMEHKLLMGLPREGAIYEAVSKAVPKVVKVRLTPSGGMWLHAVISIEKLHDGDGKSAAMAALAAHPSLKHVVVVDGDIDPDDPYQVEWAIATRFQADRGLVVIPYARGSTLDPSSRDGLTYKVIVDATAPLSERRKYVKPTIGS